MVRRYQISTALCLGLLSLLQPVHAQVTSSMLVEMREILSVSISSDGTRAAMEISQGNLETNHVDLSWVIVSTTGRSTPIVVPAGEEIFNPEAPGSQLDTAAHWDRDGHWFYYLRRDAHEVQLWRTNAQGTDSTQLTHSNSDLVGLSASKNPDELNVLLAMPRDLLNKHEEEEDRNGILYNDRILGEGPLTRSMPSIDRYRNTRYMDDYRRAPTGWVSPSSAVFDIPGKKLHPSNFSSPVTVCEDGCAINAQYQATVLAIGKPAAPDEIYSKYAGLYSIKLEPRTHDLKTLVCELSECMGNRVTLIGWSSDDSEVYFAMQSRSTFVHPKFPGVTLYAWNPSANRVRPIFEPHGRLYNMNLRPSTPLSSVPVINDAIVVVTDGPDEPPRLISINLATGASYEVYDPNPALRALTRGRAQWRMWPGADDYPGRGVIVLPDGYRSGVKYPLIITTYGCGEGLLKGGLSDGAPEYVDAHHGFIAACLEVPIAEMQVREASDLSQVYPIACDLVAALIDDQIKSGQVDPLRIGLSGHSFSDNFGAYCLARTLKKGSPHGIAAAALRGGSMNEVEQRNLILTNRVFRDPVKGLYARMGLPDPRHDPTGKWSAISTADKAYEFNTPLLVQADDTELAFSLPLWSALRDAGKPVEMLVFPQELHRLIQPIHQLVNFERQIDWFRFWLKGEEDTVLAKQSQYERWRELRKLVH
jgi:hypothetical protein